MICHFCQDTGCHCGDCHIPREDWSAFQSAMQTRICRETRLIYNGVQNYELNAITQEELNYFYNKKHRKSQNEMVDKYLELSNEKLWA